MDNSKIFCLTLVPYSLVVIDTFHKGARAFSFNRINKVAEKFVGIKGYEGLYKIGEYGNIYSIKRGKILKLRINTKGYYQVHLSKKGKVKAFEIHRLIYEAFTGVLIKGLVIDHKDNNPLNNYFKNLNQITIRENSSKDKYRMNPKCKYIGVYFNGNKWVARIRIKKLYVHIGCFYTQEEAANGRKKYMIDNNIR